MNVDHETVVSLLGVAALAVPWLATSRLRRGRRSRGADRALVAGARRPKPAPSLSRFGGRVFVIDGDTIVVNETRVRLFGMDAPELSQRGGARARSHLIRMAGGKQVRVEPREVDRYGRIVARVWLGGLDLSEAMVREGFAISTSRWNRDYDSAELDARRARRGLWAEDPADGISDPAEHRRRKAAETVPSAPGRPLVPFVSRRR